jgi:hypothetical protein
MEVCSMACPSHAAGGADPHHAEPPHIHAHARSGLRLLASAVVAGFSVEGETFAVLIAGQRNSSDRDIGYLATDSRTFKFASTRQKQRSGPSHGW